MKKGYIFHDKFILKEVTEVLTVCCKRCNNTWSEEVTHFGAIAGYARYYDCCEKCITDKDKERLQTKV